MFLGTAYPLFIVDVMQEWIIIIEKTGKIWTKLTTVAITVGRPGRWVCLAELSNKIKENNKELALQFIVSKLAFDGAFLVFCPLVHEKVVRWTMKVWESFQI